MSKPSPPKNNRELLRARFIGLSDRALRKNYFPELLKRIDLLARQEERFRRLFHGSRDIILVIEVDPITAEPGRLLEVNDCACTQLGFSRDELLGMSVPELVADYSTVADDGRRQLSREKAAVYDRVYVTKDGRRIPVEINAQLFELQGKTLALSVGRDITLRKQIETELHASEARLKSIFEASPDALLICDAHGIIAMANHQVESVLGYTVNELIGQPIEILVPEHLRDKHPDHRFRFIAEAADHEILLHRELKTQHKSGREIDVEIRLSLVRTERGLFIASTVRDITERKRWESELAESRSLMRSIIDTIPIRVFWKDRQLRFLGCNPAFARDAGKDYPEELVGKDDYQMVWAEQANRYREADRAIIGSGSAKLFYEEPQTTTDGTLRWVRTSKIPLRNGDGQTIGVLGLYEDITERKNADARIRRLTSLYAALSQCNQAIVHCASADELFHEVCRCVVEYGFVKTAWIGLIDRESQVIRPAVSFGDTTGRLSTITASIDTANDLGLGPTGRAIRSGLPQWCQDFTRDPSTLPWRDFGHEGGWESSAALPLFRDGKPIGCFTIYSDLLHAFDEETQALLGEMASDISFALDNFAREGERQRAQNDLRASEARYHTVFQASLDAIAITREEDGVFVEVNRAFSGTLGYERDEIVGLHFFEDRFWADQNEHQRLIDTVKSKGSCQNFEIKLKKRDGLLVHGLISSVRMAVEEVACVLSIFRDISELRTAENEIINLAFFDPLTGLPNRRLLMDRLQQALVSSLRNSRNQALLFVDLDNFKTLNDTLGHESGDLLLQEVAKRLTACVREIDTVARLGGDEFVLILEDLSPLLDEAANQAETIGEKICISLREPYQLAGHESNITASVGITLFGGSHPVSIGEILKQSDIAMYQAKAAGRNALRFFAPSLQAAINARAALEEELRRALRDSQCVLYFQPQVSRGRITGVEALVRWRHPEKGLVAPGEFIPLAEDTGLILPLGNWVLETACQQIAAWSKRKEFRHLSIAVNVSARQFSQVGFVSGVLEILLQTGADPKKLKLELTESMLVDNIDEVVKKIDALKSYGVSFSLDDFGTGYSSLSYLKRLPLDQLKIDRSFVTDILIDPNDAAISRMIVALGKAMGLSVIAEGVETEAQKEALAQMGCHIYQGYLFSRPMPLEDFEDFMIVRH